MMIQSPLAQGTMAQPAQVGTQQAAQSVEERFAQLLSRFEHFNTQQAPAQPQAQTQTPAADTGLLQDLKQSMLGAQLGQIFQPQASVETPLADGGLANAIPSLNISTSPGTFNGNNFERQRNSHQTGTGKGPLKNRVDNSKKNNPIGPGTFGVGNTLIGGEAFLGELAKIDQSAEGAWGKAALNGQTRLMEARGRVYNYTGFDPKRGTVGLGLGTQAQLNLIRSQYGASYETPSVRIAGRDINLKTTATAEAFVGAQGDAEATIVLGKEPRLRVGAGGFAGASASVGGGVEVAGIGINGSATGWAGAGARADLTLGFDQGKFKFGFNAGAALGLGGQLAWGITIDPKEVLKNLEAFGTEGFKAAKNIAKEIIEATTGLGDEFEGIANEAAKGIKKAAKTAKTAVKTVADTAKSAAVFAKDLGDDLKDTAKDVGSKVVDGVKDVGKSVVGKLKGLFG